MSTSVTVYATRIIHMGHAAFTHVTWLVYIRYTSNVDCSHGHASFICDMTYSCGTRLIRDCDMTRSYKVYQSCWLQSCHAKPHMYWGMSHIATYMTSHVTHTHIHTCHVDFSHCHPPLRTKWVHLHLWHDSDSKYETMHKDKLHWSSF